jgi:hypothetical protein
MAAVIQKGPYGKSVPEDQKQIRWGKERGGMKKRKSFIKALAVLLTLLLVAPQGAMAQSGGGDKPFSQEQLNQLVAPIALYPDSLLAQIFMASTYPLEVVQAARWVKSNKNLKADALTAALEKENWDPSIKSLVNFPQVLDMMNEKLDWTQKLGDAFLAQQKDVMDTVQKLRVKAQAEGNLKTTQEQKVTVEKETQVIVIESASPQVVYVPTYNPTVVYGAWAYPAYPPYTYYPPGYTAGAAMFSFGMGVAVGAAWGYAWGNCNWGHGDVNVNINQNTNINNNINRGNYQNKVSTGQGGQGQWKHNPEHRKGVSYRDQGTAQKFDRAGSGNAQSRDAYRGRDDSGRQDAGRGGSDSSRDRSASDGRQDTQGRRDAGTSDHDGAQQKRDSGKVDNAGGQKRKDGGSDRAGGQQGTDRSAFSNNDRGSQTKASSSRGNLSMSSSRGGGGGGGGGRGGGGGGGRGGGGRGR